jgi:uncharacterized protein with HEPN domain
MPDPSLLLEQLEKILEALERIPLRCAAINSPEDFSHSDAGKEHLDSISMVLIGIGEAFKKIDRTTEGQYLVRYPEVAWKGVKAVRDVMAHGYFDIDAEEVFAICQNDIPQLIATVRRMIQDLQNGIA